MSHKIIILAVTMCLVGLAVGDIDRQIERNLGHMVSRNMRGAFALPTYQLRRQMFAQPPRSYHRRHYNHRRHNGAMGNLLKGLKIPLFSMGAGGKAGSVSSYKSAMDKDLSARFDADWKTEMKEVNNWKKQNVVKTKNFKNSGQLTAVIGSDRKYRRKSFRLSEAKGGKGYNNMGKGMSQKQKANRKAEHKKDKIIERIVVRKLAQDFRKDDSKAIKPMAN